MPYELLLEPGRAIAANAGILLTRVEYLKATPEKRFAVVDAAMNDLLRPALYQAVQDIIPVSEHGDAARRQSTTSSARYARPATSSARTGA